MFLAIELSKFAYLTDKMLAVFIKSFQNHYNLNALSSIDWLSNALGIFFFFGKHHSSDRLKLMDIIEGYRQIFKMNNRNDNKQCRNDVKKYSFTDTLAAR